MKRLAYVLLGALALGACDDDPAGTETFRVRVENQSALTLEDIVIGFEQDTVEIAELAPGETSGYSRVPTEQALTLVSVRADGVIHTMEPAPGSPAIEEGDYAFVLDLDTGGGGIDLEIVTED